MTSLILLWKEDDKSDIKIARDEDGMSLLFEFKRMAMKHASVYYFGFSESVKDLFNYKVVEL